MVSTGDADFAVDHQTRDCGSLNCLNSLPDKSIGCVQLGSGEQMVIDQCLELRRVGEEPGDETFWEGIKCFISWQERSSDAQFANFFGRVDRLNGQSEQREIWVLKFFLEMTSNSHLDAEKHKDQTQTTHC